MKNNDKIIKLNKLLNEYKCQIVGNGYIDIIVMKNEVSKLFLELSELGVVVSGISWWCYCNEENSNSGCPHGMGGPKSKFYKGWFSETQIPLYEFVKKPKDSIEKHNMLVSKFILEGFRYDKSYKECLAPGLWLENINE